MARGYVAWLHEYSVGETQGRTRLWLIVKPGERCRRGRGAWAKVRNMSTSSWKKSVRSVGLATAVATLSVVGTASARPNVDQEYEFTQRQLDKARDRVTQLEARLEVLAKEKERLHPKVAEAKASCDQPFEFDPNGIKLWRSECTQEAARVEAAPVVQVIVPRTCETPFRVDKDGIKHVQVECMARF